MKPDCYKCVHRRTLPGSCHSRCNNFEASVTGNPHGISHGWFMWPLNFDSVWLESCDGFSDKPEDNKADRKTDPLLELFSILGGRL
jgi:hypothetical protein